MVIAQTLQWSHQQWKEHDDIGLFLELGLFGCWKELSSNQGYSDGRYSHVGTYFETPCAQLELHHFFIHLNIYLVPLYG